MARSTTRPVDIDPAVYVNENAYANDEFTQFMNEVFVNSRNAFLPAYDWGGVLVWKYRDWTFSGVGINVGENDDGNNYNFYAAEADYHIDTALGEGKDRIMISGTSKANLNPSGENREPRSELSLSFDQALGPVVGAFLRLGWQREDAAVDFKAVYSGGLNFKGAALGVRRRRHRHRLRLSGRRQPEECAQRGRPGLLPAGPKRLSGPDFRRPVPEGRLRGRGQCRGLGPRHAHRGRTLETGPWEQATCPDGASLRRHPCRGRCGAGLGLEVGQRCVLRGEQEPCAEIRRS